MKMNNPIDGLRLNPFNDSELSNIDLANKIKEKEKELELLDKELEYSKNEASLLKKHIKSLEEKIEFMRTEQEKNIKYNIAMDKKTYSDELREEYANKEKVRKEDISLEEKTDDVYVSLYVSPELRNSSEYWNGFKTQINAVAKSEYKYAAFTTIFAGILASLVILLLGFMSDYSRFVFMIAKAKDKDLVTSVVITIPICILISLVSFIAKAIRIYRIKNMCIERIDEAKHKDEHVYFNITEFIRRPHQGLYEMLYFATGIAMFGYLFIEFVNI